MYMIRSVIMAICADISYFFGWIKWRRRGKPYKVYSGYNCGCCGKWVKKKTLIPTYQSQGRWMDTWGLCTDCQDPTNKFKGERQYNEPRGSEENRKTND